MNNISEKDVFKLENVYPPLTKDQIIPFLEEFSSISPISIAAL